LLEPGEDVMQYEIIKTRAGHYISVASEGVTLSSEADVLDLLGICGTHKVGSLLIHQKCLDPAFYNLKSGLAGMLFHKLSTYRIRAAFIGRWDLIQEERFKELMYECNRGGQLRFFASASDAEAWLLA
jgi:hypothetical protein